MKRSLKIIVAAATGAALAAPVAVPPALGAGGDFGPNTCLNEYVWRNAFPGDVVCVSPESRDQAARDNAAAASRVDPDGAYGPHSCRAPFVWRVARPSDLVCVTPAIRKYTATDNARAASRRNSVVMTLSRYFAGDAARHRIAVTNINVGTTTLYLFRMGDGKRIQSWYPVSSERMVTAPGGRVSFRTNLLVCNGEPNAYFRIKDPSSGRWSERRYINVGCKLY